MIGLGPVRRRPKSAGRSGYSDGRGQFPRPEGGSLNGRPLSAGGASSSVYSGRSPVALSMASGEDGEQTGRRWSKARNGREASVLLEPAVGHAAMLLFGAGNGGRLAPARFGSAFLAMPEALDS